MNLYQIANEYKDVVENMYDEETGEINEKSLSLLDSITTSFQDKCLAVASFMQNIDAEREAISNAKKSMADRESRLKKKIENMHNYLHLNMEKSGITQINSPYFNLKIKTNPPSVDVIDANEIPEQYMRTKTEVSIDKQKILADLKNGTIIPGVGLKQDTKLEIK